MHNLANDARDGGDRAKLTDAITTLDGCCGATCQVDVVGLTQS